VKVVAMKAVAKKVVAKKVGRGNVTRREGDKAMSGKRAL
jgi:hypothetical protein